MWAMNEGIKKQQPGDQGHRQLEIPVEKTKSKKSVKVNGRTRCLRRGEKKDK